MKNVKRKREKVKRYVNLTHVYGSHKVLCPWHDDSHPSCHIYPNGAYCFSCGESGDQIQFVEDYEDINHIEAIEMLLEYAQGSPVRKHKDRSPIKNEIVDSLVEALWNPIQFEVFKYLLEEDRRLTTEIITKLHLGWSDTKKSIAIPYIVKGQVRNIKFRILPKYQGDKPNKYEGMDNKPFNWLYPYDYERRTWPQTEVLFVTEGEFDAMALLSIGFPALSLPNGASTDVRKYLKTLKLYDEVYMLYDMDEAGNTAADKLKKVGPTGENTIEAALPTEIKRIKWPTEWGKDVTEALNYLQQVLRGFYEPKT